MKGGESNEAVNQSKKRLPTIHTKKFFRSHSVHQSEMGAFPEFVEK